MLIITNCGVGDLPGLAIKTTRVESLTQPLPDRQVAALHLTKLLVEPDVTSAQCAADRNKYFANLGHKPAVSSSWEVGDFRVIRFHGRFKGIRFLKYGACNGRWDVVLGGTLNWFLKSLEKRGLRQLVTQL